MTKAFNDTGQIVCVNIDEDNRVSFLKSISSPMLREIAKYLGVFDTGASDDDMRLSVLGVLETRFSPVNFYLKGEITIQQNDGGSFFFDAELNGEKVGGYDDAKRRDYGFSRDDAFKQAKEDIKSLLIRFIDNLQFNSRSEIHTLEDLNNEQSPKEVRRNETEEVTRGIDRTEAGAEDNQ